MSLEGKRVVVIGGTSGIGFAVAEAAIGDGASVVVASSQPANVDAAVGRLGQAASGRSVNVRDEADVEAFFDAIGAFDHLAFTAGDWSNLRTPKTLPETDLEAAKGLQEVRYWGAVRAIKHGLKSIAADGSVTLTNGTIAHRPRKGTPLSTAMAGSIEHLVRGLAVDLAPLRVNCVCPAGIRTGVWDSIPEETRQASFERMTARQPIARIGEPAEVAEAFLYLMRGGYTTGQVLLVDGGGPML
ncbi:MAG TPA: SDR family oxidoreductase [Caulobacteraceae bacterium]|nr:SDR family oxidoreductase [Caulobacteraceae bacterium]